MAPTETQLREMRSALPEVLVEHRALVEETYGAALHVAELRHRAQAIISAVYTIGNESGWEDEDLAALVDSLWVRQADRVTDALARLIQRDLGTLEILRVGDAAGLARPSWRCPGSGAEEGVNDDG